MGLFSRAPKVAQETRSEEAPPRPPQGYFVQPPPRPLANEYVAADQALCLASVYRAVSIISAATSQLTLDVYRDGAQIPAPTFVKRPDVDVNTSVFLEQTTVSLATRGNAFWFVSRNERNQVMNIRVINADEVNVDETGARLRYDYRGKKYFSDGAGETIRHLQLLRLPGHAKGLGPIQAAQSELRGAMDLRSYAGEWFSTAGVPSGVLTTDEPLNPEDAKQYKEQWYSNPDSKGLRVLGQGLRYEPILLKPEDAQFLESRQFSTTEIARLFGVPAHLMLAAVEGTNLTYANVQDADLSFVRWGLSSYTREIETAFSDLLPRGQQARFNLDAFIRPATTQRYQAHQVALSSKFMTVNEVRAIEGLPPLPDGDIIASAPAPTNEVTPDE